uniref:immune-associated nucleotide-binding protein 9-like n=1 Tax=Erigeron canadensis TaxID=72917 RepID=UPI001CB8D592|nr:immune-associated nucleotide-binding protein 9-like [Erigeron canadensis]
MEAESSFECGLEFPSPRTLVLLGRKGDGKSATGNSILGANVFRSERSSSGVTITSDLQTTQLEDGQMINVIDTPGLVNFSLDDNKSFVKEIKHCLTLAGDTMHAFLVVFSVHSRFSKEEEATIRNLVTLFGRKIYDYMIVVFTGGDELDQDNQTLEDFLNGCPETLKETLEKCENRCVLFDNKTTDQAKRASQVKELCDFINTVSSKNGDKPYTNEMFTQAKEDKEQAEAFQAWKEKQCTEYVRTEMVEPELKDITLNLERQITEELVARVKAEEEANAARKKLDERKISWRIQKIWKKPVWPFNMCSIL